jgi:hypothetical protein
MQNGISLLLATGIFFVSISSHADDTDPWFTGPLLALSAQNIDRGDVNVVFGAGVQLSDKIFNNHWASVDAANYSSTQIAPMFAYGLTDHLDFSFYALDEINQSQTSNYHHVGDATVVLGYQVISQDDHPSWPDFRFALQQDLPTGLFTRFSAFNAGAESTGTGSYQTTPSFNFDYLKQLNEQHYLKSQINFSYTWAAPVRLSGLSAYGGTLQTNGIIHPGNSFSIDLAEELTLTQNWVAVMEVNYIYQFASTFSGTLGTRSLNDPIVAGSNHKRINAVRRFIATRHNLGNGGIGSGTQDQISLAPAMEYNFSENYGVIAGVWFTVAGRNIPQFMMPLIEFTATW